MQNYSACKEFLRIGKISWLEIYCRYVREVIRVIAINSPMAVRDLTPITTEAKLIHYHAGIHSQKNKNAMPVTLGYCEANCNNEPKLAAFLQSVPFIL